MNILKALLIWAYRMIYIYVCISLRTVYTDGRSLVGRRRSFFLSPRSFARLSTQPPPLHPHHTYPPTYTPTFVDMAAAVTTSSSTTETQLMEALRTLYFVDDRTKKQAANRWLEDFQKTVRGRMGWAVLLVRSH